MERKLSFPENFLWGSATSAYQIEGGIKNCDWSGFKDAGLACDHYNRYEEDFDLLKNLNQNAFRLSVEWSRIEPQEGKFNEKEIEHYKKVLIALKKRGIIPFVTLYHWTNPLWFKEKGGWLNPRSPDYFAEFVEKTVGSLKEYVDFWITVNEPIIYAANSYYKKRYPPQERSFFKTMKVIKNLIKSHRKAYNIIHKLDEKARVSVAKNNIFFEPYNHNSLLDKFIVNFAGHFWNDYFLDKIKYRLDFIGLNHYFHVRLKFPFSQKNEDKIVTDVGWEVYPEAIYHVLKELKKYNLPIYITENGLADARDKLRKDFIRDHLYQVYKAIGEGTDVRGFFHWSLMDNFEWDKGFEPRFGLVEIDYRTLERKPRPSAFYYAQICKNNSLSLTNNN